MHYQVGEDGVVLGYVTLAWALSSLRWRYLLNRQRGEISLSTGVKFRVLEVPWKPTDFGRMDSTMSWTLLCGATQRYNNMIRPQEGKIKSNPITDPTPRALFWTTSLLIPILAPPKWGLQFRHPPLDTTSSQCLPYTLARPPWCGMLLALSAS